MGKVASKIWEKYVINLFADQHKLPERVEAATFDVLRYLCNDEKK